MTGVWLWLPRPGTLDSGAPEGGEAWAAAHGFSLIDLGRKGLDFAAAAARLAPDGVAATCCDWERWGWVVPLAQRCPGLLAVYGPGAAARSLWRAGVPLAPRAPEGGLPERYGGPPLPPAALDGLAASQRAEALRAGYDPDLAVLDPLPRPRPPSTPGVVFEGGDGAGKSTQAVLAAAALAGMGWRPRVVRSCRSGEFYQHVSRLLQRTVCRNEPRGWRFCRLVKAFDSVRIAWEEHERCGDGDAVVWDRYLETHLAAARMRFGDDAGLAELIDSVPRPRCSFLLDLPHEHAAARVGRRGGAPTLDENPVALRRYRLAFRAQARAGRMRLLDGTAPAAALARAVEEVLRATGWAREGTPA